MEEKLNAILCELEKLRARSTEPSPFLNKTEAADMLRVHPKTLSDWRREHLKKGIHYTTTPRGEARYIRIMLEDWFINRENPAAHQRAIEVWNQQRLANAKSTPSRRPHR